MPKVFIFGEIKATWAGGQVSERLVTAPQVSSIAVRLLVEDVGTQKARRLLRRELARYRDDYEGDGKASPEGPLKRS